MRGAATIGLYELVTNGDVVSDASLVGCASSGCVESYTLDPAAVTALSIDQTGLHRATIIYESIDWSAADELRDGTTGTLFRFGWDLGKNRPL